MVSAALTLRDDTAYHTTRIRQKVLHANIDRLKVRAEKYIRRFMLFLLVFYLRLKAAYLYPFPPSCDPSIHQTVNEFLVILFNTMLTFVAAVSIT
jgi:hypothetical protein